MAEQVCVLIHRTLNGQLKIYKETDFITALAKQRVILLGIMDVEFQKSMLTREEIEEAAINIKKTGQHRICSDTEEVILVFMKKRDTMR